MLKSLRITTECNRIMSAIIDELQNFENSLMGPLLKIKVMASRLGNAKVLEWVNNEINGYEHDKVPEYRNGTARTICNLHQGYHVEECVPLPAMVIGLEWANAINTYKFTDGVASLEALSKMGIEKEFGRSYGSDFDAYITREMHRNGQRLVATHIQTICSASEATKVLATIRNKLLDLMLELEREDPDFERKATGTTQEKQEVNQHLTAAMHVTITGSNNIINTGSGNDILSGFIS